MIILLGSYMGLGQLSQSEETKKISLSGYGLSNLLQFNESVVNLSRMGSTISEDLERLDQFLKQYSGFDPTKDQIIFVSECFSNRFTAQQFHLQILSTGNSIIDSFSIFIDKELKKINDFLNEKYPDVIVKLLPIDYDVDQLDLNYKESLVHVHTKSILKILDNDYHSLPFSLYSVPDISAALLQNYRSRLSEWEECYKKVEENYNIFLKLKDNNFISDFHSYIPTKHSIRLIRNSLFPYWSNDG